MFLFAMGVRVRYVSAVLALVSIFLLGCARKLQIEIPADFHGAVHITCTTLTADRTALLQVTGTELTAATCPERQADVVITRSGDAAPVIANVSWITTGDGLVRGIRLDVK